MIKTGTKNPHAVALGRKGGVLSAKVRLAGASKKDLSAWGRRTVQARWDRRRVTLKRAAEYVSSARSDIGAALREFYHDLAAAPSHILIADEPPPTGNAAYDAYLAAVAETAAARFDWNPPAWVDHKSRFLPAPYFANAPAGMRIYLLQASPGPFRRRNIFVDKDAVTGAIRKCGMERSR
ncbi:MAG: hypothetical protein A3G34_06275 [Candidatus Lindowbacteria bacterium RIFCSPLOWO2_12_FULL_62_27]|nr:MAG: hypothetical protein A3G34_06275 [Candidatus Lindowbacteria bacterium RIFCSPLOWO2_12_FULL_62_27]OGH58771.1 MAG: hypothetical protein A3I06_09665 [Candidatus Lindowbacteria bacterium RIFCSPLOWO2_02_FULL_62_12]